MEKKNAKENILNTNLVVERVLPLLPSSLRRPSPPWRLCPLSRSSAVNTASFRRRSSSTPLLPSLLLLSLLRPPSPPSQEEELPQQREQAVIPAQPAGPVLDEYDSGVARILSATSPGSAIVLLRDGRWRGTPRQPTRPLCSCKPAGLSRAGQVAGVEGPVSCAFSI